jgi:hypothetical protein
MIVCHEDDIGRQLARDAFYGTSHFHERRGDSQIESYLAHMTEVEQEFSQWATDDNRAEMTTDLEAYRSKYAQLLRNYLHSHSNVVSAFIAGPSNFPARQMNKRSEWADNHMRKLLDFSSKQLEKLRRKYDPRRIARAPISSDDTDAVAKLQAKVEEAQRLQELMKAANKVVRGKKLTDAEKIAALVELGLSQTQAHKLFVPDFAGRIGFPGYQLTNNNANIRRMKARIEDLERKAQDTTTKVEVGEVQVIDNVEENRVQIIFPAKPSNEIRSKLKANGFHWAPRWDGQPWQRYRSDRALQLAKEIASEYQFPLVEDEVIHCETCRGQTIGNDSTCVCGEAVP